MSNKYYDASLTDHIVFLDEPVWLTRRDWLKEYKGLSGIYDQNLVDDEYNLSTKLPFVYYAKTYADNRPLYEKSYEDHLHMIGGMGGLLLL